MDGIYVRADGVSASYSGVGALFNIDLSVPERSIYALIGPSGCGKSTFLRSVNRLNDHIRGFRLDGEITVGGQRVYALSASRSIRELRMGVGMIFQRPNPLPATVMQNMLFPYREHIRGNRAAAVELATENLRLAGLLDELGGRLDMPATRLSGGQQQRLCIARALMLDSKLLLLDEPCSALDPISTYRIEDLLLKLKNTRTIIMVTHNMEQARRISDYTALFWNGRVVERGASEQLFAHPTEALTDAYVRGAALRETDGPQRADAPDAPDAPDF
ncbi:MAG: ATP-binding cassette domain-containing protein [Oscillospiraceae bacterium]|jgi:phosphate transport system ATP-binding protein|nr:ATP-binding cassette domain-containing protein [Oscillospiraceae bacterium]